MSKRTNNKRLASKALAVEDSREKSAEKDLPSAQKVRRGEKIVVSRAAWPRDISLPIEAEDVSFLEPAGSKNHCSIDFYVRRDGASNRNTFTTFNFELAEQRTLTFGVTGYQNKPPLTVVVPMREDLYVEDALHMARAAEFEAICKAFLLSDEAADAWRQVGLSVPSSAELDQCWNPIVTSWKAKRTGLECHDMRLKFNVLFNGSENYTATDYSVPENPIPCDLLSVQPGMQFNGSYRWPSLYIRPTPGTKKPFSVGVNTYVNQANFYANPNNQVTIVD